MRAKLYLEVGSVEHEGGSCLAWVLDLPGCVAYAASPEEAIAYAPEVARHYLNWLSSHGESVPDIEVDPKPAEVFQVSFLGDYEISAIFGPDFGAPSDEELQRYLRWMRHSREDLWKLIRGLSKEALDVEVRSGGPILRKVLQHVAGAEEWYISRLEIDPFQASAPGAESEDVFERLETVRAWAVERLQNLPIEQRKHITVHEGEVWTFKKVLRRFLYHEAYHRRQIAELLDSA
jgi:uncharacterized damage-inducible protein DinB/predicted RNase H-like HicB family nuclease